MKKIIIYFLLFLCFCFLLPIILTKNYNLKVEKSNQVNDEVIPENSEYKYNNYEFIKLLHSDTNQIEEKKIDEYLYEVVSAEMPASYCEEAIKAQAVVARTYTLYKINSKKHNDADICDDYNCCQAWISKEDRLSRWNDEERNNNWDKIVKCVDATKGEVIVYDKKIINALFHSNSGGKTENPINVWGGESLPYLQVVETVGENEYSQYFSEAIYSKEQLEDLLKEKYSDIQIDDVKILEYTESDRVKTIKIGNHNLSGVEARILLNLKSTNFSFEKEENNFHFFVKGYGHGVGMSQTGANTLAKENKDYKYIINHFYNNVEIVDVNSL